MWTPLAMHPLDVTVMRETGGVAVHTDTARALQRQSHARSPPAGRRRDSWRVASPPHQRQRVVAALVGRLGSTWPFHPRASPTPCVPTRRGFRGGWGPHGGSWPMLTTGRFVGPTYWAGWLEWGLQRGPLSFGPFARGRENLSLVTGLQPYWLPSGEGEAERWAPASASASVSPRSGGWPGRGASTASWKPRSGAAGSHVWARLLLRAPAATTPLLKGMLIYHIYGSGIC